MISTVHANTLLDHLMGISPYTAGTLYLAVYEALNGDTPLTETDLVGSELTVAGYERQAITFGDAQEAQEGRASVSLSTSDVTYTATSGSQVCTAWAICTGITGGSVLWFGEIGDLAATVDLDGYTIPAKALAVAIENGGITAYTRQKLLDLSLGVASYSQPSLQLRILDTSGVELSGFGYNRIVPIFNTASSKVSSIEASYFNTATGAWDCKFLSLYDGTNEIARGNISETLSSGQYLAIANGAFTVGLL